MALVGHVPKMLIFKAGIDFYLWSSLPPPPENQFHDGMNPHKKSILGNRCLVSLKASSCCDLNNLLGCDYPPPVYAVQDRKTSI